MPLFTFFDNLKSNSKVKSIEEAMQNTGKFLVFMDANRSVLFEEPLSKMHLKN